MSNLVDSSFQEKIAVNDKVQHLHTDKNLK